MENCVAQNNRSGLYARDPEYNMRFSVSPNNQLNYTPREAMSLPANEISSINQGNYSYPLYSANNFSFPNAPFGSMAFPMPLPFELSGSTLSLLKATMSFPCLYQPQSFTIYRNLEAGCIPLPTPPAPCFTRPCEPSATLERSNEVQLTCPNTIIHRPKPISISADKNGLVPRVFDSINLISSSGNVF